MSSRAYKVLFLLFLFILSGVVLAQEEKLETEIQIEGKVFEDDMPLSKVKINIQPYGGEMKKTYTDSQGGFNFMLEPDNEYTVEFSKNGYIAKRIYFNTMYMPQNMFVTRSGILVNLFRDFPGLDFSILLNPIGKFYYYADKKNLHYEKQYTDSIEKLLAELSKKVKEKKKELKEQENEQNEIIEQKAKKANQYNDSIKEQQALAVKKKQEKEEEERKAKKNYSTSKAAKTAMYAKIQEQKRQREEADSLKKEGIKAKIREQQNQDKEKDSILPVENPEDEELAKRLFNEKLTPEQRKIYEAKLLEKYPIGITREEKRYAHFTLVRVIIILEKKVDEFKMIDYPFGSYFKKNGNDITREVFDLEISSQEKKIKTNTK